MIIRLGKRELETTRSRLRNTGLMLSGEFDVLDESVRIPAVVSETLGGNFVESTSIVQLTKNVLLVTLEGAPGETPMLVYPGFAGNLVAKLKKKPNPEERVYFRVALLFVGAL